MRHQLLWSIAMIVLAVPMTPADAVACHNTMYRHQQRQIVKKQTTVQQRAWDAIRDGEFERAREQLTRNFPHLSPLRVNEDHVGVMAKSQREALHALVVVYTRTRRHTHWARQMLEALEKKQMPQIGGHLAEAYALSDAAADRDRGWAMLETLFRDRELSDSYTLTLLAVLRIQAGDVTGGRLAFATAQNQKRHSGLGETVCCVVGELPSGDVFGGIGLGKIGTVGKAPSSSPGEPGS